MTSRRLSPRFAIALLPALAGCAALAVPPNNSTDLGRVYYACDFAVVERVMDLAGVVDQINERERQRTACIRAGGPVAAAPASVVTLTPPVPEATAPPIPGS